MHAFPTLTIAIALAASASIANAQQGTPAHHDAHAAHAAHAAHGGHGAHQAAAPAELTEGEVKKIDKDAGKITLRHGELKNLNMAPMTMVFRVKDPAMLDAVKVGSMVKFAADRVGGAITIVQLQAP